MRRSEQEAGLSAGGLPGTPCLSQSVALGSFLPEHRAEQDRTWEPPRQGVGTPQNPVLLPLPAPRSSLSWGSLRPPAPTRALSFLASPGASIALVQIAEPLGVRNSHARGEGKESGHWQGGGDSSLPLHPQLLMQHHTLRVQSLSSERR